MSEIPGDLKFLKSHEWARVEGNGRVTIGISDHAQGLLGDLVYVDPERSQPLVRYWRAGSFCLGTRIPGTHEWNGGTHNTNRTHCTRGSD